MILQFGGTPVIFLSYGLTQQSDDAIVAAYAKLGSVAERFVGFELGTMFAPFGKIYSLEVYRGLMGVKQCLGAKHSSLRRDLEWQRLALRDATRPDFRVYTGNDITMSMARSLPVKTRKSGRVASRSASRCHSRSRRSEECFAPRHCFTPIRPR